MVLEHAPRPMTSRSGRTDGLTYGVSWPMSVLRRFALATIALTVLASSSKVTLAGPLQPCIAATLSANGSILVLNQNTFDDPKNTYGQRPRSSSFLVLRRHVEKNYGVRLDGPNAYWGDPLWNLIVSNTNGPPFVACPYTLVTDDGEYLILVGDLFEPVALSIYRRRGAVPSLVPVPIRVC
jgi:hypothetical protein